ncbi:MAG: hypothetical protein PHN19_02075 [Patescibacteria group bacterium]|nr:hypothetical protein [Patescibacteria group bacterium]
MRENFEEELPAQLTGDFKRNDFLDEVDIERIVQNNSSDFRKWGYKYVGTKEADLRDYNGLIYAKELDCENESEDSDKRYYLVLNLEDEKGVYRFSGNNKELTSLRIPSRYEEEWLQDASESAKKVKSRPAWMYPELFDLPKSEVWPKGAKIAVIGDPYQACDKEGVTIIEYEYADEIMPPILRLAIEKNTGNDKKDITKNWLSSLYDEDFSALKRMHGMATPEYGSPYCLMVNKGIELMGDIVASLEFQRTLEAAEEKSFEVRVWELRAKIKKLINGTWAIDDFENDFDYDEGKKGLRDFFQCKQEIMSYKDQPEKWDDFIIRWKKYLSNFPRERLKDKVPDLDRMIEQVEYWLEELPRGKSAQLVTNGMNYLENFYYDMIAFVDPNNFQDPLYDSDIAEARSTGLMSDGAFGVFVPGYPVNLRTRKFLETIMRQTENMLIYGKEFWPKLKSLYDKIQEDKIPLNEKSLFAYLRSFEEAMVRDRFFVQHTQKAVPVHGFFPYDMSGLDPQDRILALTSVTMHGWNRMDRNGFSKDITKAINFLTVGGKYILGPVNQYIYFGGQNQGFDSNGLTEALKSLRAEGLIEYEFRKGKRNYSTSYDLIEQDEEDENLGSYNDDELGPDEAAHSLIITRLK